MKSKAKQSKKKSKDEASSIHIMSYRLLHSRVQFLYPRLAPLESTLKQAMMPIPFEVYVCSIVFFRLIAGVIGLIAGIIVAIVINIQPASFLLLSS